LSPLLGEPVLQLLNRAEVLKSFLYDDVSMRITGLGVVKPKAPEKAFMSGNQGDIEFESGSLDLSRCESGRLDRKRLFADDTTSVPPGHITISFMFAFRCASGRAQPEINEQANIAASAT
jgi:hypothetical protein